MKKQYVNPSAEVMIIAKDDICIIQTSGDLDDGNGAVTVNFSDIFSDKLGI